MPAVWKEQRLDFSYLGPRLYRVFSAPALPDAAVQPLHPGGEILKAATGP